MRKQEQKLWDRLSSHMKGMWLAERIESMLAGGVPDVFFTIPQIHGWIELKVLVAWPKRPTTRVVIEHFTAQQGLWLFQHDKAGGHVWFFLEVAGEHFLIRGVDAKPLAHGGSGLLPDEVRQLAIWQGKVIDGRAIRCLI